MRVTESLRFDLINRRLSNLQSEYLATATQALTGQRVNVPSDDPIAAAEATRIRSGLTSTEGYQKSIAIVQGDVEMAESALAQVGDILQRTSEIAMTGSNGSCSADQRKALALETNQLIEQIVGIANTKGSRGYLFAGTLSNAPAMSSTGAFLGNDGQQLVDLGTGDPTAVNLSGSRAFTAAGGTDLMQTLRTLAQALEDNDSVAVRGTLDAIQNSHDQVQRERSRAGTILNRLDMSATFLEQTNLDLEKRKSAIIDADAATTLSRLTQLESSINNSIAVGKQLLSLSSIDRF